MKTTSEWLTDRRAWGKVAPSDEFIEAIQRDALDAAAAICYRSEDDCTKDPMCHAHDAAEIEALKPREEKR